MIFQRSRYFEAAATWVVGEQLCGSEKKKLYEFCNKSKKLLPALAPMLILCLHRSRLLSTPYEVFFFKKKKTLMYALFRK